MGLEGPSPREALFEAVPEANLILAQAPAEQDLLALSLRGFVVELERRKFAATDRPRPGRERSSANPRHIPASVKRLVWARDGGTRL